MVRLTLKQNTTGETPHRAFFLLLCNFRERLCAAFPDKKLRQDYLFGLHLFRLHQFHLHPEEKYSGRRGRQRFGD